MAGVALEKFIPFQILYAAELNAFGQAIPENLPDGALDNLSIAFASVPTTGIYRRVSDGRLSFVVEGVEVLILGSTVSLNGRLSFANLPTEVQNVPFAVSIPGSVPPNLQFPLAITQTMQLPASFVGAVSYSGTRATNPTSFAISMVRSGSSNTIGTITFTSASSTGTLSTQPSANFLAGDVLVISTPTGSMPDPTLANVGITIVLLKQ